MGFAFYVIHGTDGKHRKPVGMIKSTKKRKYLTLEDRLNVVNRHKNRTFITLTKPFSVWPHIKNQLRSRPRQLVWRYPVISHAQAVKLTGCLLGLIQGCGHSFPPPLSSSLHWSKYSGLCLDPSIPFFWMVEGGGQVSSSTLSPFVYPSPLTARHKLNINRLQLAGYRVISVEVVC